MNSNRMSQQIRAIVESRTAELMKELARAERETLAEAQQVARDNSSGSLTPAALAKLGHPYAVRHKGGARVKMAMMLPPELINSPAGAFPAAWKILPPAVTETGMESHLINDSPVARWMKGTSKMVPRPILTTVVEAIRDRRKARIREAVKRAWGRP